jgi:alanyl-tRNA synthetase
MAPKTSAETRQAFLDYFASKGHKVVSSGPLVPPDDPTLMFANAGMVQFKDVFLGREKRSYSTATTCQKCMRVSGKHNDLENVGRTARHHTFFEMLGNFSFGDYFKEDAIAYAWELLTRVYELPPERLIISVFGGGNGIPADDEARAIWRKVSGFGDDRIIGLGPEDNFWQMGETGPCGPNSEIHFLHGDDPRYATFGSEPAADGTGWVELYNLVFMQFDRAMENGQAKLTPLPAPCIDTGAGLDRIAAVIEGKRSNYDNDLLKPLIERGAAIAGKPYGGTMGEDDVSMRVIADHARAAAFLIAEGVMPDRTGRAYVLRRVMRRAIRHGHRLGIARPFLHEVALEVVEGMGGQYPELRERRDLIASVTEQEEIRFRQTIDRGLGILEEEFERLGPPEGKKLSGDATFKLYDTFGFPVDLTEMIARERGYDVDVEGYERALEQARAKSEFVSRSSATLQVYRDALTKLGNDVAFVGYDREKAKARVAAIIKDGKLTDRAAQGDKVEVVLDTTPFYGEAGGQIGDQGTLAAPGLRAAVRDSQKPLAGLIVHEAEIEEGVLEVGLEVTAEVDHTRRDATRRSHSATHLLHYALRRVLGESAQQKGSLVEPDRLRFDFTSARAMTAEERATIENLVNEKVLANAPVETEVLPIETAKKRGAMAIFEEKYGDVVRVLTMTPESVELCGGTHARATGDIGLFKILSEVGIAAGVRRIEATTGLRALHYVRSLETTLGQAAQLARASGGDLVDKIEKLVAREKELDKKVAELSRKVAMGGSEGGESSLLSQARDVAGVKVLAAPVDVGDMAALRDMAERLRDKLGESSVVLVGSKAIAGKVQLVLTVSKALLSKLRAAELIRPVAQIVGGSGGGRPDMAQAGGSDPSKLDEALAALPGVVEAALAPRDQPQP